MNDPRDRPAHPPASIAGSDGAMPRGPVLPDAAFDETLRRRYQASLARLSPRTGLQLRQGQRASLASTRRPRAPGIPAWGLAAACSLLLVVGVGVHRRAPAPSALGDAPGIAANPPDATLDPRTPPGRAQVAGSPSATALASLDQPPDLYVWLASDDARALLAE